MSAFEFQAMPPEVFIDDIHFMKEFDLPLVTTCAADFILAINTNHGRPVAALHRFPAIGKKDAKNYPYVITKDHVIEGRAM